MQFNPQSLKVNFSNQKAGGDQPKGSSTQFVGKGVTKLTMELWFDIALAQAQGRVGENVDVRSLTQEVAYFMTPQQAPRAKGLVPPGVRFRWGSFIFAGVMDSMDETIDLFSHDGKPLRASVSISISKQEIQYDSKKAAALINPQAPGVQPYTAAPAGKSVQDMAGKDWKSVAQANGIENPRMLAPGTLVNLSAGASISGGAQLGIGASITGGASVGVIGGTALSGQAGISATGGASIGGAAGIGVNAGAGVGVSGGIGASAGVTVSGTTGTDASGGLHFSGG